MMATGNTEGKGSSGAKFRVPPANVWNNMIDAGNAYALSKLDSPGGPPTRPRATDIIKIQNTSGAARRTGEILKIEGKALDTITAEHIWLIGVETTEDCYFGILRKPVADDGIEQLQVSGACLALVDIADVEHTKAKVAVGSYVLESSDSGPLEILYAPETTGEQTCVVRFAGGHSHLRVVIIGTLTAPTGATPTTGIAAGLDYDPTTKSITANDKRYAFYNFDRDLSAEDGTFAKIEICEGIWDCYWVGCGAMYGFTGLPEDPEA